LELNWRVFPNPTSGLINLYLEQKLTSDCELKLFDVNGKLLMNKRINAGFSGNHHIDLGPATLAQGLYLFQLSGDFGVRQKRLSVVR